jgi:hypothetical protein
MLLGTLRRAGSGAGSALRKGVKFLFGFAVGLKPAGSAKLPGVKTSEKVSVRQTISSSKYLSLIINFLPRLRKARLWGPAFEVEVPHTSLVDAPLSERYTGGGTLSHLEFI